MRQRALRELVFETLLLSAVRGELAAGTWINHQRMAKEFQVSATPVREALQELATFGIVETHHNCGTVVRPFGPPQLADIYRVRAILESAATRLACGKIDPGALLELKAQIEPLLTKQPSNWANIAAATDHSLHELIAQSAQNQRLQEEILRYRSLAQVFCLRQMISDRRRALRFAVPEHLEIVNALLDRNAEKACAAMEKHIQSAAEVLSRTLFRGKASPPESSVELEEEDSSEGVLA